MNINEALNSLNISTSAEYVTLEEVKKAYRLMCKKYHPDHAKEEDKIVFDGVMKTINAAYDFLKKVVCDSQEKARKEGQPETDDINLNREYKEYNFYNYSEHFENILRQIYALDGLVIEICGNWAWISGETYKHREALKMLGCIWAKKKENKALWFYRPAEHKSKNRDEFSMDKIRDTYGCATYRPKNDGIGYQKINLPARA